MENTIKDILESKIEIFASKLRGKIVMPSDSDYNNTRKVYNGMINKHPGMIAMCVDVADVIDLSGIEFIHVDTLEMIRQLHEKLNIPTDVLIQAY